MPARTPKRLLDEAKIHAAFQLSLLLKGGFALLELVAGIGTYLVTKQSLVDFVNAITKAELTEDPRDFFANHLLQLAQKLSVSERRFAAFYLVGHGILKLWLITGLLRAKLGYYPAALAVFGLFIVYQLYRFEVTNSLWLLAITVIDLVVIALTWHEYRYVRKSV